MTHLTPEQFVDIAEGTTPESSSPHLATCEACRIELAGLRAMMSEAAIDGDVPEPSPLFWNHLSSRVHEAVAADAGRPTSWFGWLGRPRALVPALAAALAMLIAVVLLPRGPVESPAAIPSTPLPIADATLPAAMPSRAIADDPQLQIVAAVATTASWDDMMDEISMSGIGTSDALAGELTADEQAELQRLLMEQMTQAKAQEKRS